MESTIFEAGVVIEGEYKGLPYKFQTLGTGHQGAGAIYGRGLDVLKNQQVFLKKYIDPAPRSTWFKAFIEYQEKIQRLIEQSSAAKQLIAGIHLYFQHKNDHNRFWQAIEYVENSRDLKQYLESNETTWEQRKKFAMVFMYAMKVLHEEVRLVHADLKPANLLLIPAGNDNYRIKLIDFDRPILLDEETIPWAATDGYIGSPGYYSPEHMRRQRPTEKSDVFTCGLILHELLTKEGHPYNFATIPNDYHENTAQIPHLLGRFGNEAQESAICEMLHRMLDPDPERRPTAGEVHALLVGSSSAPQSTPRQGEAEARKAEERKPMAASQTAAPPPLKGAADVVFLVDSTGSMGKCISALREHIGLLVHKLVNGNNVEDVAPVEDWRARVVGYRDFTDCNKNNAVARNYMRFGNGGWLLSHPFTRDEEQLRSQLADLKAFGGGKEPEESLLDALMLVLKSGFLDSGKANYEVPAEQYRWRRDGVGRIVIIFTDAGYHHEMSYDSALTRFSEKGFYPLDLKGAGLDELQHAIESGFFKLYVFGPNVNDYDELSELTNVMILHSDDAEGKGLVNAVADPEKFEKLIDDIAKGVSRSSSELRVMPMA